MSDNKEDKELVGAIIITRTLEGANTSLSFSLENITNAEASSLLRLYSKKLEKELLKKISS